ncbi:MAG: DUF1842 domain-containing protein [Okeania sp. SIO3B5]|uniref:DUF1842 domain-containing protein n=1 Tax=Okeania sp. SIO3B5 TaxID=2607811 RepID=UPI0013FFFA52|nr:DUF1842 domain-containing protein [Okeania sp. SIO3B5]NEO58388.1 DUF1842 domain-containing protein [Okeania sp. SIO3B5]
MKKILATVMAILAMFVMTVSPAMAAEEAVGLFPACYSIGSNLLGAPHFDVQLLVDAAKGKVTGEGKIFQAVSPPLDIQTELLGAYKSGKIANEIKATGYPDIDWPPQAGIGPVIPSNVELRMLLSKDNRSGAAIYGYREGFGEFKFVGPVPAASIPCFE